MSRRALLGCALGAACAPAAADGWRSTNVELLHGPGFELGSGTRTTVTVEHAQGWAWGDFYGFVDTYFRDDIGTELYGEAYLQFSLSGLSGRPVGFGPVSDVDLSVSFHGSDEPAGRPFRAFVTGVSFDLALPGFNYAQFDVHAYKNDAVDDSGIMFTPVWSIDFRLGRLPLRFRGHVDVLSPDTNVFGNWHWLTQPQLMIDAGAAAGGTPGHVFVGIEHGYWHNKYGIDGVDESSTQALLELYF